MATAAGTDDGVAVAADRPPRLLLWLFVIVAAASLLVQEGAITGYDGLTVHAVTESMVERGTFAIHPQYVTLEGRDGLHYGSFGIGLSAVGAVPYLIVRPLATRIDRPELLFEAAASAVMALVTAALVVVLYATGRRLGGSPGSSLAVAIGAVAGTYLLPYTKEYFSEPLTALLLAVAIERLLADRSGTSGLAAGAAVLVRPQSLLFAPVLAGVALWRQGPRAAMRLCTGLLPGVAGTFAYNLARFADPFEFGYGELGFTNPVFRGVGGLLFEPTKSLLLFAPIVVVLPFALWRLGARHPAAALLLAGNLVIVLGLTVKWFAWHGSWCWGPRLVIPGLVPALAAIAPWMRGEGQRRLVAGLFALGLAVSLPALFVSTQAQQLERDADPLDLPYFPTAPLDSPSAARQVELVVPTARYSVEHLYDREDDGYNYMRYLSLWQLGVIRVGGRAGLAAAAAGTLLLVAILVVGSRNVRRGLTMSGTDPPWPSTPGASNPHDASVAASSSSAPEPWLRDPPGEPCAGC